MRTRLQRPQRAALVLATAILLVAPARVGASLPPEPPEPADRSSDAVVPADVRRWEFIVLVRTHAESVDAIGRAEKAAFAAGAAVLDTVRSDYTPRSSDYKLLVRLRDRARLGPVLRAIQSERGVLGATAAPLPETPTHVGGPSFMLAYTTDDTDPKPDGVVVHHDVPPVLDRRDLLETFSPPSAGPSMGPGSGEAGGVGFNISELFARLKASSWARRERRMKEAPLPILLPEPSGAASAP